jgi:hypothetical protein
LSATVIGDDELGAPFAQLFSPFKPGAKEATRYEITHHRKLHKDPKVLTGTAAQKKSKTPPYRLISINIPINAVLCAKQLKSQS